MTRIMRPLLSGMAIATAFLNAAIARPLPWTSSALNDTSSLEANNSIAQLYRVVSNDSASGPSTLAFHSGSDAYNGTARLESRSGNPTNIPYVATNAEYTFWWKVRVLEQLGYGAQAVLTAMTHDTQRNNPGMQERTARAWVRSEIQRLRPLFEGRPNRQQLPRINWAYPLQRPGWVQPPPVPVQQDPFHHAAPGPAGPVPVAPAQVWPPPPPAIYYPPPPPQPAPPAYRYMPSPDVIQSIRDNFQFHLNCGLDVYEARMAVLDEEKRLNPYVSPADHDAAINEILGFHYRTLKSRDENDVSISLPDHASGSDTNSATLEYDPAPVDDAKKLESRIPYQPTADDFTFWYKVAGLEGRGADRNQVVNAMTLDMKEILPMLSYRERQNRVRHHINFLRPIFEGRRDIGDPLPRNLVPLQPPPGWVVPAFVPISQGGAPPAAPAAGPANPPARAGPANSPARAGPAPPSSPRGFPSSPTASEAERAVVVYNVHNNLEDVENLLRSRYPGNTDDEYRASACAFLNAGFNNRSASPEPVNPRVQRIMDDYSFYRHELGQDEATSRRYCARRLHAQSPGTTPQSAAVEVNRVLGQGSL